MDHAAHLVDAAVVGWQNFKIASSPQPMPVLFYSMRNTLNFITELISDALTSTQHTIWRYSQHSTLSCRSWYTN
jgi:hypothetical protein